MKKSVLKSMSLLIAIGILSVGIWHKLEKDSSSLLYQAHDAVKEEYGILYIPNKEINTDTLTNVYGLHMDDVDDYIAESAMMSTHVDVFIGVKAKKGKSEIIANRLEAHRQALCFEYRNDSAKLAKVKASKVTKFGDFVFLMILGQNSDVVMSDATQFVKAAETEYRRGEVVLGNIFK